MATVLFFMDPFYGLRIILGFQQKAKKINGSLVLKERFGYNYRPSENKTEVRVRVHNSERIEADEEMNHSSLSLTETEFRRV